MNQKLLKNKEEYYVKYLTYKYYACFIHFFEMYKIPHLISIFSTSFNLTSFVYM